MSIRAAMTPMGPVHVRMTSIVRGDDNGPGVGIVNAPTTSEATAELHRVARVSGADKVVSVAADYRRAAIAGGTASTQWRIEVQAWGTAMGFEKVSLAEQEARESDAEKAREAKTARKADADQAKADHDADRKTEAATEAKAKPVASTPAPLPEPAPAPVAEVTAADLSAARITQ